MTWKWPWRCRDVTQGAGSGSRDTFGASFKILALQCAFFPSPHWADTKTAELIIYSNSYDNLTHKKKKERKVTENAGVCGRCLCFFFFLNFIITTVTWWRDVSWPRPPRPIPCRGSGHVTRPPLSAPPPTPTRSHRFYANEDHQLEMNHQLNWFQFNLIKSLTFQWIIEVILNNKNWINLIF